MRLVVDHSDWTLALVRDFAFKRKTTEAISFSDACMDRVDRSEKILYSYIEKNIPIYGVTTGYGDSCHRVIAKEQSATLQHNLISYLRCGTGPLLCVEATRATFLIRLKSLSRGYSGVSQELLDYMARLLEHDILPEIPCEGSLGASGDLIPLAYIAATLTGEAKIHPVHGQTKSADALKRLGLKPYKLKPKEGLALVNGTSAMAGVALVNINHLNFITELALIATSWTCLALGGKFEAFGDVVNNKAKKHSGQVHAAFAIRKLLSEEQYAGSAINEIEVDKRTTKGYVQDRYSLRCAPQIIGPVLDTLRLSEDWLHDEVNSTSDNPLVDPDTGELAMGGNFYGGYMAHSMDYLKICAGHLADLCDRQLMLIIDEKSSRGLPPNLAAWHLHTDEEKHLHHGLKALHQSVNAITSEILAMAGPSSTFSRSSELHNQDKVSLGMSAAMSLSQQIEKLFTVVTLHIACLAQALDLANVKLKGATARAVYQTVRDHLPFVKRDMALHDQIRDLRAQLMLDAVRHGHLLSAKTPNKEI